MRTKKLRRGYPVHYVPELKKWAFTETGEIVTPKVRGMPCGHCGLKNTPEGHDGCLGVLPGVKNACCGHGDPQQAYVMFDDDSIIRHEDALEFFRSCEQ